MTQNDFIQVLKLFTDPSEPVIRERDTILASVNGDVIDIKCKLKGPDLWIDSDGKEVEASFWIAGTLAKLDLLARRIIEQCKQDPNYISPTAAISRTDQLDNGEIPRVSTDALADVIRLVNDRQPLETNVIYITSDAGEGKTSLIVEIARQRAVSYLNDPSLPLIIPIALGGKHFLRFDDITAGALQNRYRFPFLYYQSFMALVKLGFVVPAYDGFEEMLVENSSGEALSAMSHLLDELESQGTLIIAARKTYYEFESMRIQEKLFDSISQNAVSFSNVKLNRWTKGQFIAYCEKSAVPRASMVYEDLSSVLDANHSLLTRPVFVKELVRLVCEETDRRMFIERVRNAGADYLTELIRAMVEREAHQKWINRAASHEIGEPLLTIEQHMNLLASIAGEMWSVRRESLTTDLLELVTELFCESERMTPFVTQQTKSRIKGHAILISSSYSSKSVEFDHEEYRNYFLGQWLANLIGSHSKSSKHNVATALGRGLMSGAALDAAVSSIRKRKGFDVNVAADFLVDLAHTDSHASFIHENAAAMLARLLSTLQISGGHGEVIVKDITFPPNALNGVTLSNVKFTDCYFSSTKLEQTTIYECEFRNSEFEHISITSTTKVFRAQMFDTVVNSIRSTDGNEYWAPRDKEVLLRDIGFVFSEEASNQSQGAYTAPEIEEEMISLRKVLRYMLRSTHISESVIRIKLGSGAHMFIEEAMPILEAKGVFQQIPNHGGNLQKRYKLVRSLVAVNSAVEGSSGSFKKFLELVEDSND